MKTTSSVCPKCQGRGRVYGVTLGARYDPGPGGSLAMSWQDCECVWERRLAEQEFRKSLGRCTTCGRKRYVSKWLNRNSTLYKDSCLRCRLRC